MPGVSFEMEASSLYRVRPVDEGMDHFHSYEELVIADKQLLQGTIALLGDASHPTLPYQGQGAAMAVEDGAILGTLLAKLRDTKLPSNPTEKNAKLTDLFRLYEGLRKKRTETNVLGAIHTRHYYHLADGEEQRDRDAQLAGLGGKKWQGSCSFNWGDAEYQKSLLGFDVLADAERRFDAWWAKLEEPVYNRSAL